MPLPPPVTTATRPSKLSIDVPPGRSTRRSAVATTKVNQAWADLSSSTT